jgi:hypothetical protein
VSGHSHTHVVGGRVRSEVFAKRLHGVSLWLARWTPERSRVTERSLRIGAKLSGSEAATPNHDSILWLDAADTLSDTLFRDRLVPGGRNRRADASLIETRPSTDKVEHTMRELKNREGGAWTGSAWR